MRYNSHELPTTADQFLRWEETTDIRHEYVAGQIYAMTGVTTRHNRIMLNLALALQQRVERSGCQVFAAEVMLKAADDRYYYPDVMVACGTAADVELIVTDPTLVAEVTSRSTRRNDHHEKADAYMRKPSMRVYLIVDQRRKHVVVLSRAPSGEWTRCEITDGEIPLAYFASTVSVDDIYRGVKLPPLSVGEEDEPEGWENDDS